MIEKNIRVNNEFYVAPVYNEAIEEGKVIKPWVIDKMWGLGTPEDLNHFLNHYQADKVNVTEFAQPYLNRIITVNICTGEY